MQFLVCQKLHGRNLMKRSSDSLKGTDDIMSELNKDGGRYLPVWMKPATAKTKSRRDNSGNKTNRRTKKTKDKSISKKAGN